MAYSLFIGRFSPFHNGYKYIIDKALKKGKDVCIAIRDTKLSDKDPYTYEQRKKMIDKVYEDKIYGFEDDKIKIIKIPDIESVNVGRKAGYDINKKEGK